MPISKHFIEENGLSDCNSEPVIGDCLKEILSAPVIEVSGRIRSIIIDIENSFEKNVNLHYLGNYLEEGVEYITPQILLDAGKRDGCVFANSPDNQVNPSTSGFLIYKISAYSQDLQTEQKCYLVIMWHVPFDYTNDVNWYGIGCKENISENEINKQLFDEMFYSESPWFHKKNTNDSLHIDKTFGGINVFAGMTGGGNSYLKVDVRPNIS